MALLELLRRRSARWAGGISLVLLLAGGSAGFAIGGVELVSRVDPGLYSGTGTLASFGFGAPPPSLSADGRYVAFISPATNLVPGQNGVHPSTGIPPQNVFLHDRVTGATTLVSHAATSTAATANDVSEVAVVSADGRWVAFLSQATDLVTGPEGSIYRQDRLFLWDRVSGTTTLVSSSVNLDPSHGRGVEEVALSADGRYVAFVSDAPDVVPGQRDTNREADVFLFDRTTGKTVLVSHTSAAATTAADFRSLHVAISGDGRFIAFHSLSSNLVANQGNAGVFLYDRVSAKVSPVGPGDNPAISADGSSIAFLTAGDVFTGDVYLYSRATASTVLVSHAPGRPGLPAGGASSRAAISADGRYVAFLSTGRLVAGQVSQFGAGPSAFLYDRTSGGVVLASRFGTSATTSGNQVLESPALSADGRFVAFVSDSKAMVPGQVDANGEKNVFLFDRTAGATTLVSAAGGTAATTGNGRSLGVAISAGGAQIAYYSEASDLVAGTLDLNFGQDTLLYDTASRTNTFATLHAPGEPSATANVASTLDRISSDGRYVVFKSPAPNLVPGQTLASPASSLPDNVFLYDRVTHTTVLASRSSGSPVAGGDDSSGLAVLSADGRYVAFLSQATNLVAGVSRQLDPRTGRTAIQNDLFLFDRVAGTVTLVSRSAIDPGLTGNGPSGVAAISADGRWIAFASEATDLVAGVTFFNNASNLFLYDRVAGTTSLISRSATASAQAAAGNSYFPILSPDGRYTVFTANAPDLVPGQTGDLGSYAPGLFSFDRTTGAITVVSHTRSGAADVAAVSNEPPGMSTDARFVVFASDRPNLTDVPAGVPDDVKIYVYDRLSGASTYVSHSSGLYLQPSISADGRWIAFLSNVDQLVAGFGNNGLRDQAYLYDRSSSALTLLTPSATLPGRTSLPGALFPQVSQDGHFVAFSGGDVLPGQLGELDGVYLYDRLAGTLLLASRTQGSALTSGGGSVPMLSADGRRVAFNSQSSDLVPGDFNAAIDVFLFDLDAVTSGPVPVPPCALFDGSLRSNLQQVLVPAGTCGVPATATRVTVKVTARQATGTGNLRLYPGNVTATPAGTLRFQRGKTASSSFDLPLATDGAGTIAVLPLVRGNGTVRVTVEVDGYTP